MSDLTWSMTSVSEEASVEVALVEDRVHVTFDSPRSTVTLTMTREAAAKLELRLKFAL